MTRMYEIITDTGTYTVEAKSVQHAITRFTEDNIGMGEAIIGVRFADAIRLLEQMPKMNVGELRYRQIHYTDCRCDVCQLQRRIYVLEAENKGLNEVEALRAEIAKLQAGMEDALRKAWEASKSAMLDVMVFDDQTRPVETFEQWKDKRK